MQPSFELTPGKEHERIQALWRYAVLDTPPEEEFDELTELAARLFDMPVALVSLVDASRQWFKSRIGLDVTETPRTVSFCQHAIASDQVMVVEDAEADARFKDNALVTGAPGIRFYAGAPLVAPGGHVVGTLCIIDYRPRELSATQRAALAVLSRQVVAQLELRLRNAELQRERTRLALVLEGATDGWWDWNVRSGERYFAPAGWAMLGHADQALPVDGRLWASLVHHDDLPHLRTALRNALRHRHDHFSAELRLRHKAGHLVPAMVRGYLLRGVRGRVERLSGTLTDLSPMRRSEQQRLAEQDNYEALFANSIDGVILTHRDGRVIAANAAACAMLGHSEAELRRRGRDALLDASDPRLPALLAERGATGHARGELRMIRATGEAFEIDISMSIYTDREGRMLSSTVFRDNTERRTWARRLEESLALLRNLARRVPGVIYQYRLFPDGRSCFPFASEGLWGIYEVTPDEVKEDATPVFGRLHPDDLQPVADAIAASAATLLPWHQEYRVILPEQGERWRLGEAQPERLDDGSVLWHGFITDITDRRRADDERRASAQVLQLAVRGGDLGLWDWNFASGQLTVNERWMTMLGLDPGGPPPTMDTWGGLVHPDDRAKLDRIVAQVIMDPAGREFEAEVRARHRDGHFVWILDKGAVVERAADGRPLRVAGTHLDITDRRRAEVDLRENAEKLSGLYELSPLGIALTDMSGKFVEFNEAFLKICGYDAEELQSLDYWALTPRRYEAEELRQLKSLQDTGRYGPYLKEYIRKDGTLVPLQLNGMRITGKDGLNLIWSIVEDITERRNSEQALLDLNANLEARVAERTQELQASLESLRQAQDDLVRSEKLASLGALVAGVAHELNTPIGNAVLMAGTLAHQQREFEVAIAAGLRRSVMEDYLTGLREATEVLERNLQRAATLIGSFKQIAVDQSSYQRRAFELSEVVQEIALAISPTLRYSGVKLLEQVPSGLHMESYPGPLGQVLINLVNNAVTHAFEPGAAGCVRIAAEVVAGARVRLSVSDDGRGIPRENLKRIFDPFFTTRLGQGGSGLGLHIVYTLVTGLLGGRIDVRSEPGRGTEFTIELPCVAPVGA